MSEKLCGKSNGPLIITEFDVNDSVGVTCGEPPIYDNNDDSISGLHDFIERIERLELEKSEIQDSIKEVYDQADRFGFKAKIIRQIIRLRKMDESKYRDDEIVLAVYKRALGMLIV